MVAAFWKAEEQIEQMERESAWSRFDGGGLVWVFLVFDYGQGAGRTQ